MNNSPADILKLEDECGHKLTMIAPYLAGISRYYCENCGAFVTFQNGVLGIFHVPPGSPSKTAKCVQLPTPAGSGKRRTLRQKLDDEEEFERLKHGG